MTSNRMFLPLMAVISLAAHGADGSGRERVLARLARVAELYRYTALGFACQETISYSGSATGRIRFAYMFIRDESGKLRDSGPGRPERRRRSVAGRSIHGTTRFLGTSRARICGRSSFAPIVSRSIDSKFFARRP